ncbi:hypothetical protein HanLR1_Chr00c0091g0708601 [Helianthus annuus]|nr:hypothetical protein HanHA89_Chr01g0011161 [Helianthus annuus]KAJ0824047.1 hypothetical protein HanLR1_Chr00c0091g0708601 [Helianthus annuus]
MNTRLQKLSQEHPHTTGHQASRGPPPSPPRCLCRLLPLLIAAGCRCLAPPPLSRLVGSFTSTCSLNLGVSTG